MQQRLHWRWVLTTVGNMATGRWRTASASDTDGVNGVACGDKAGGGGKAPASHGGGKGGEGTSEASQSAA